MKMRQNHAAGASSAGPRGQSLPHRRTTPFDALLHSVLSNIHLELSAEQVAQLTRHYELLIQWNAGMNLTSVCSHEDIAIKHFGESLFLARMLNLKAGNLVDVGSGAGFPGYPLAVAFPNVDVTLAESVAKKAAFLKELTRGAANVQVFHGRFEDVDHCFDWAVARAVRLEGILSPLRRKGRKLALLIGEDLAIELSKQAEFQWRDPIRLPWGRKRVLLMGSGCSTWNI